MKNKSKLIQLDLQNIANRVWFVPLFLAIVTLAIHHSALNGFFRHDDGWHLGFVACYAPWEYFFVPSVTREISYAFVTPWNPLTYDINLLRFFSGQSEGRSLTPEEVANYPLGPQEEAFIASRVPGRATGTPAQVRARLEYLAELHQADEIMAVSNMYYCEDRKRCFELLRNAFATG